jgi:dihydroxyacetone kinase-like protein
MITKQQIIHWLELTADKYEKERDYLTELDKAIGDADHGNNMNRGFQKVKANLAGSSDSDIKSILSMVAKTLISSIGGAAGPLYGTLFLKGAAGLKGTEELTDADLLQFWEEGIKGVQSRGRAEADDKTMVDTLLPALESMKQSIKEEDDTTSVLKKAAESAKKGMEDTIPLIAKKGRASYLGERSKGHQDPGATSSYYMINALAEAVSGKPTE